MSGHCPKYGEPWKQDDYGHTLDADGVVTAALNPVDIDDHDFLCTRAARAVACVNALAGVDEPSEYIARLRAENAAMRERGERMVPDEWRVRYYQLRGCISTDPMMDGTNKIRGVNIPILNSILEQHRNNPVEGANDAA